MRLPIQYALTYPHRLPSPAVPADLIGTARLDFRAPDEARFPALRIAREAGRLGPRASAALIAADDVAVERFLAGTLSFTGIPALLEAAVDRFGRDGAPDPDVDGLIELDAAVRAAFATTSIEARA
jgi:1-deoxy-D-xylulose-5-phosphate reductoisomerase